MMNYLVREHRVGEVIAKPSLFDIGIISSSIQHEISLSGSVSDLNQPVVIGIKAIDLERVSISISISIISSIGTYSGRRSMEVLVTKKQNQRTRNASVSVLKVLVLESSSSCDGY